MTAQIIHDMVDNMEGMSAKEKHDYIKNTVDLHRSSSNQSVGVYNMRVKDMHSTCPHDAEYLELWKKQALEAKRNIYYLDNVLHALYIVFELGPYVSDKERI